MQSFNRIARVLGAASLLALASTPVLAEGKHDRAEQAIAAAHAKIDAANRVGAGMNSPHLAATAEAALRTAEEDLSAGHKENAIRDAIRAQQLADTALNQAQAAHVQAVADNRAAANAAQAQAVDANARAQAASAQTDVANARADAAAQAAASAAADAQNARAAVVEAQAQAQPQPQPQATTVTTETTKSSGARVVHSAPKKVVKRSTTTVVPRTTETTKTTVTTAPQN
jgi:hypothetical protein